LHQIGDLFELNVKLRRQKVKYSRLFKEGKLEWEYKRKKDSRIWNTYF